MGVNGLDLSKISSGVSLDPQISSWYLNVNSAQNILQWFSLPIFFQHLKPSPS